MRANAKNPTELVALQKLNNYSNCCMLPSIGPTIKTKKGLIAMGNISNVYCLSKMNVQFTSSNKSSVKRRSISNVDKKMKENKSHKQNNTKEIITRMYLDDDIENE